MSASPSTDEVRRAVQGELSDKGYQRTLPNVQPDGTGFRRYPQSGRTQRGAGRSAEPPSAPPEVSSATRMVASSLLWVLMIACGGVVLFIVARAVFRPRDHVAQTVDDVVVHDAVLVKPLDDARRLAQGGRYADAIHTLLLRTLQELTRVSPDPIPSSLTSREILRRVALPDAARSALSGLIDAVEITHFGGREPDESGYQMCVRCFDEFARSYAGGAA